MSKTGTNGVKKLKTKNEELKGMLDAHRMKPPKGSINADTIMTVLGELDEKLDKILAILDEHFDLS